MNNAEFINRRVARRLSVVSLLLPLALVACSSEESLEGVTPPTTECPRAGDTQCVGLKLQTCEADPNGSTRWGAPTDCPGDRSCRATSCEDPTETMRSQSEAIAKMVDAVGKRTAWHQAVDLGAVRERERLRVLKGDGTDLTFFTAAWRTLDSFPQGHQGISSLSPEICGRALPYQLVSAYGVCGRPSPDGVIVTFAKSDNVLGLTPGDIVVQAGDDIGAKLFESAYLRPACGNFFPAPSGRRTAGAAAFFNAIAVGTKLVVRAPNGATREVVAKAGVDSKQGIDCSDPFSRSRALYAEAKTRPDGVAVIRLPSFFPWDKQLPTNATEPELRAFIDSYQNEIVKVFESVKTAPAIVWDARGNWGGITTVALAIVSGFPSARSTNVSYCKSRSLGSSPPAFSEPRFAVYDVSPGGPFVYQGKVAVITDGIAYSAGDYFPLAVARGSDEKLIGTPSAGAFGGGAATYAVNGPPDLNVSIDSSGCFDATTDTPLEGTTASPTAIVDYDPNDLAAGKDTFVERAVRELGF